MRSLNHEAIRELMEQFAYESSPENVATLEKSILEVVWTAPDYVTGGYNLQSLTDRRTEAIRDRTMFTLGWLTRDACEDPDLDGTPFRSNSYTRGEEYGWDACLRMVSKVLDGSDTSWEVHLPKIAEVKKRLIDLVAERKARARGGA